MANEFIARKGLIALEDSQITGSLDITEAITSQGNYVLSRSSNFTDNEFLVANGEGGVESTDALAVDSSGNLGIGISTPEVRLHMRGESAQTAQFLMEQYNDTADAPDIRTRRFRGTPAAPADVQTGDYLFRVNVEGRDGGSNVTYGSMQFDVDGTDQGALNWKIQTRDTGGTLADRITIDSAGDVNIDGDLAIQGISNVSASIAAASGGGGGGTPGGSNTQVQFNDNGSFGGDSNFTWNKTTNTVSILSSSLDLVLVNDRLQGNGSGFQFFAFNEDTIKVKFANWYSSNDRQYGMGQLWYETWFAAIDNQAGRDNRRIGFYLEEPDAGSTDSGTPGQHPSNARFYVDITGSYVASGGLHVTDADFNVESNGNVEINGTLDMNNNDINNVDNMTIAGAITASAFSGSELRIAENGTGLRMTNRGAFDADGTDFRIFATNNNLKLATDGSSGTRLTLGSNANGGANFTTNITSSGNISASGDITANNINAITSLTASGINYPSADGTDGQVIITDGAGNLSFSGVSADDAEAIHIPVKNTSGVTITKGTPVYITGNVGGSERLEIAAADASDSAKMPAVGLLESDLDNNDEGFVAQGGYLRGLDTDPIDGVSTNSNDTIYVKAGGGLTVTKPTGSALIQNIAKVARSHGSAGSVIVSSILRTNDVPNLPTGKIWVGSDSYTVTSSVISLDETNKYVSGSESAKFQIGTYAFGYNAFPGFGFDITGSGIIVSSSLPSEHYPMVKIGETELLDLSTDTALADHTFTIHNVDNFQVTSGSEPTDVSTNKLFEHTGNAFNVYTNGDTTKIIDASATSIKFGATDLYLAPSSTTYVKATSTSTPQYVAAWNSEPNVAGTGAALKYVTASTFTGGGGGKSTSHTGYLELKTNSQTVLMAGPGNGIYSADRSSGNDTTITYNHGGTIPTPGVTTDNEYPYYLRGCMVDLHHDVSELSFNARMRDQGQQAGGDEIFISLWYNSSGAADTFTQQTYTCIATGSTTFPGSSLNIINVKISATATGLSLVEGGSLYYGFGWVDAPPSNPDVFVNWSLNLYE